MSQLRHVNGHETLERTRYFPRQIVTAEDLQQDGNYFLDKHRRHNRLLHGWGIKCLFSVFQIPASWPEDATPRQNAINAMVKATGIQQYDLPDPDAQKQCSWIIIQYGYAVAPQGQELYHPCSVLINTREENNGALVTKPGNCSRHHNLRPTTLSGIYFLVAEASVDEMLPVRAAADRCGDHPEQYQFSRLQDRIRFKLLDASKPVSNEPYQVSELPDAPNQLTGTVAFNHIHLAKMTFNNDKITEVDTSVAVRSVWKPA